MVVGITFLLSGKICSTLIPKLKITFLAFVCVFNFPHLQKLEYFASCLIFVWKTPLSLAMKKQATQ
jgi:hypothetical protein